MLLELKKAFLDREVPIYRTCIEADVNHNKVSKIIHGLVKATPEERRRLALALNRAEGDLFPNEAAHV